MSLELPTPSAPATDTAPDRNRICLPAPRLDASPPAPSRPNAATSVNGCAYARRLASPARKPNISPSSLLATGARRFSRAGAITRQRNERFGSDRKNSAFRQTQSQGLAFSCGGTTIR